MKQFNPYILLEWDPTNTDLRQLEKRIDEKSRKWSHESTGAGPNASRAKRALPIVKEYKDLLTRGVWKGREDPERLANLKTEAIKIRMEFKSKATKEVQEALPVLIPDGFLPEAKFKQLLIKYRSVLPEVELRRLIRVPIKSAKKAKKSNETKPMLSTKFEELSEKLEIVDKKDLYDFLSKPEAPVSRKSSTAELRRLADKRYDDLRRQNNKTTVVNTAEKIVGIAKEVFDSAYPERRAGYELALDLSHLDFLIGRMLLYAQDSELSADAYENLMEAGMKAGSRKSVVDEFITTNARKKKLTLIKPSVSAFSSKETCPVCNSIVSEKSSHCTKCGSVLSVKCPKCGTKGRTRDTVCSKCGFALGEMDRSKLLIKNAAEDFAKGKFTEAKKKIAEAEIYWPDHPKAFEIKKKILQVENEDQQKAGFIQELMESGKLAKASTELANSNLPYHKKHQLSDQIGDRKTRVLSICRTARNEHREGNTENALTQLEHAVDIASDLPEVLSLVRDLAPRPPSKLLLEQRGRTVKLKWSSPSKSAGLRFDVRRKNLSSNSGSFELIQENVNGYEFIDSGVNTGQTYQYSLVAKEKRMKSEESRSSKAITITEEVKDFIAILGDNCINLFWILPKHAVSVRLVRKEGGKPKDLADGIKIKNSPRDGYTDHDVVKKKTYGYRICTAFRSAGGGHVVSSGKSLEVNFAPRPPMIESLNLEFKSGQIEVDWSPPSKGMPVLILVTQKLPSKGISVPRSKIGNWGVIQPITGKNSTRIKPSQFGVLTFAILNTIEDFAVVGASTQIKVEAEQNKLRKIRFKIKKPNLFHWNKYRLFLWTTDDSFESPKLVLVNRESRIPLSKADGSVVQTIDPLEVSAKQIKIEIPAESFQQGHFLNLLVDSSAAEKDFRIIKPSQKKLKV